uniref:Uncharacterized protein n=1 Tax=Panagrellus redivivus TaxID=6233 RepID=A0A7E4W673_PANRE
MCAAGSHGRREPMYSLAPAKMHSIQYVKYLLNLFTEVVAVHVESTSFEKHCSVALHSSVYATQRCPLQSVGPDSVSAPVTRSSN